VAENDISKVKLGDKASFAVGYMPDEDYHGEVIQIDQSPQTIQNIMSYGVVIGTLDLELWLKPSMTTVITVVVDRRDNVLRAPIRRSAIHPAALRLMVKTLPDVSSRLWVLRAGKPIVIPVQLGLDAPRPQRPHLARGPCHA
jgi:HlyD family secretion protein